MIQPSPSGADITGFLTLMSALSASTQQFVEHVLKRSILRKFLEDPAEKGEPEAASKAIVDKDAAGKESHRQSLVHLCSFAIGATLSLTIGLKPLGYLGVTTGFAGNGWLNAVLAGMLIAYGGSLFDEGLGAVREFKKAQENTRKKGVTAPAAAYSSTALAGNRS